jgi:endonuclease/exonuclease/phosphatase family metal-dependent hydrolase
MERTMKKIFRALTVLLILAGLSAAAAKTAPPPGWRIDTPVYANYVEAETPFTGKLQVIAFNIERGSFWPDVVKYLQARRTRNPATIVLLSETDRNHSRTHDVFVADEMARALKMNMVFATEFIEFNDETKDTQGDHGNAILSPWPLTDITVIRQLRLVDWGGWYGVKKGEPRYGDRVSIGATALLPGGKKVRVYTVHLESFSETVGKWLQLRQLMPDIKKHNLPTVIGGDFNELPGMVMFGMLPLYGVRNAFAGDLSPTGGCKPSGDRAQCRIKIDWIIYKGLKLDSRAVDYPLNSAGGALSDHVPVRAEFQLP